MVRQLQDESPLELCDALTLKFERLQGKKGTHYRSGDEETALFAGGFKGRCNNCGKHGHKARDCRTDKNNNKNNKRGNDKKDGDKKPFPYKCHYCKKQGHMAKDCFKKKKDEEKKGETANTAQDKKDDEVGFVLLDLKDPVSLNRI